MFRHKLIHMKICATEYYYTDTYNILMTKYYLIFRVSVGCNMHNILYIIAPEQFSNVI